MTYKFRTSGPWGPGTGADLDPVDVDNNFWQAIQDIQAKSTQGVGIDNIVVIGNQFTVVLTDHTTLGPYTLPMMTIEFKGTWQPTTSYTAGNIVTYGGSTYFVNVNHTSAATFDPGANDGQGHDLYGLLLSNPAASLPAGGPVGTFLRKAALGDYITQWATAALTDLSDTGITSPTEGQFLQYVHGLWQNITFAVTLASLSDVALTSLSTGDVLTWDGTHWVNQADALPLNITTPTTGQTLVYNSSAGKWVNSNYLDPPLYNIGNVTGSITVDLGTSQAIQMTLTGNVTIASFTMPALTGFMRRVINVFNTGAYTLTWPSSVKWPGGTIPTMTPGSGKYDTYVLHSNDGFAIYGDVVGQDYH